MANQESLLERLARDNNMSVEEMYKQLEKRLVAGLNDPDPKHRAQWERIPCARERATVEEWLEYVVKRVYEEGREDLLREYLI